jgi:hypothetical protein
VDRSAGMLGIVIGALFLRSNRVCTTLLDQHERFSYADCTRDTYGSVSYAD